MLDNMGVMLHTGDLTTPQIMEYANTAEKMGFEGFWLTEESGKNAFALLSLLAEKTQTIQLYTGIVSFLSRTPMLLAMSTRQISDLSGGRFTLGIGTGGIGFVEQGHGLKIERPVARARETIEIVRKFLTEDHFSYDGEWFHVRNFHLREGPIGDSVKINLAALGPMMVKAAAKYADGFITNWVTEESLKEFKALVREGAEEVGRDPATIRFYALEMVTADPEDESSRDVMRRGCAFYFAAKHYQHIAEISGFGEEARRIREVWLQHRDYDRAAKMVSDEMLQKFTLTGPKDKCRSRLKWLNDEGVYPIIYPVPRRTRMVEDHWLTLETVKAYVDA